MANNYQSWAVSFSFPEQAAREFVAIVNGNVDEIPEWFFEQHAGESDEIADLKKMNQDEYDDFIRSSFEDENISSINAEYYPEDGDLYVSSDESLPDLAAEILSETMSRHNINKIITISSCFYCDKLRPGEFGGVSYAIGPGDWTAADTAYLCRKLSKELSEKIGLENQNKTASEPKAV